jgi:hypothetical protein
MQRKENLSGFVVIAILVGTIVSMTMPNVFANQTDNSRQSDNIITNNCQGFESTGNNANNSAIAAASVSESGATDDADEPGDIDVNDEEDIDTGNDDAGEANDVEDQ